MNGPPPGRVIFIGLDDARWDDVYAYLQSGRPGERAMQTYHDRLLALGENWTQHRVTAMPCWPARAEWHTGMWAMNHGINASTSFAEPGNYEARYVNGEFSNALTFGRSIPQWMGPYIKDLSLQQSWGGNARVGQPSQTGLRNSTGGWPDDLQAFTGSIFQQLAHNGVHCAMLGKETNGKTPTDPIMAGVTFAKVQIVNGAPDTNLSSATYIEYTGANPANGNGVVQSTTTRYFYNASATHISWATNQLKVTTGSAHGLAVGDVVWLTSSGIGLNKEYLVAKLDVTNPNTIFYVNEPTPFATTTAGTVGRRKFYSCIQLANWATQFMDSLQDSDPFFVYLTPHQIHENDAANFGSTAYNGSIETRYLNSVSTSDPLAGGANDANYAAQRAAGYVGSTAEQSVYVQRNEIMASVDDMLKILLDYCDTRFGIGEYTVMFVTDQGEQIGEHALDDTKTATWDGSARSMLVMRGPLFRAGQTVSDQPTVHADLPLTILDCFGLTGHHWHQDRDGRSLLRVQNPNDQAHNRFIPVTGDFKTGQGTGFVDRNGGQYVRKYVMLNGAPSTMKQYYVWVDPNTHLVDYENTPYTPTSAEQQLYGQRTNYLFAARWNPGQNQNPANNGQIT